MRIQSDKPLRNGGYLHRSDSTAPRPVRQWKPVVAEQQDFSWLMREFGCDDEKVCWLASSLGVSCAALRCLDCAWAAPYRAFAFPMKDGAGQIVGIRLRNEEGKKWAVRGSKQGLFFSNNPAPQTVFICEGPTDTAAALTIGLWAIGRPSCLGGNEHLRTLLKQRGVKRAVILSDNDAPGINGAQRLTAEIALPCALLVLPAKDVREAVKIGMTKAMIECLLRDTIWRTPENRGHTRIDRNTA